MKNIWVIVCFNLNDQPRDFNCILYESYYNNEEECNLALQKAIIEDGIYGWNYKYLKFELIPFDRTK